MQFDIKIDFERIRNKSLQKRPPKKLSIQHARERKFVANWEKDKPSKPLFEGIKTFDDYSLEELIDYIDWSPFFHAWELKGLYPKILSNKKYGDEANKLFNDGKKLLNHIVSKKLLSAKAVIGIHSAYSKDESVICNGLKFDFPRQLIDKGKDYNYSLADFVATNHDYIGTFAVTTGHGLEQIVKNYEELEIKFNIFWP